MEDFAKKYKIPLAIGAGAVSAFGLYQLWKMNKVHFEVDENGYILDPKFTESVPLYKEESVLRKKIVSKVHYDLVLALKKGATFDGQIVVTFDVSDVEFGEEELFIDYHGLGIKHLKLNGAEVSESEAFNGQRIVLSRKLLKLGETNTLSLTFKSKYRNNGTGAHHFTDTEDGSEYIYTQMEAFECHRVFPTFNQPDLRAIMSLRTLAPQEWIVISNSKEHGALESSSDAAKDVLKGVDEEFAKSYTEAYSVQKYNDTLRIAPYLFAFIAGPYDFIERHEKIPGRDEPLLMRLYFRKSLRKDAEKVQEFMFDPAVRGIHWYSEFFGFNYPYDKYDQIFCPEFRFGAMENVGTVTFTEKLMFRGKEMSEKDKTTLTNVNLHELCHHWFGDLVTMTWWNDLWLNESFATYVSFLCMSCDETLFKQCPNLWINVNSYKNWGYAEDDLVTGHPICKQAPHTDSADDMINGITYGKGCSFLKQLFHLIGYETFSLATKIYFERHQWQNTTLPDFLKCLNDATDKLEKKTPEIVVSKWAETFLNTRGANVFEGHWTSDGFTLKQLLSDFSDGLRQQKIDIIFFDEHFNQHVETILTSETEDSIHIKMEVKDKKYYIINHGDHAYGKIILDPLTLDFLSKNLSSLTDSLDRAIVWKGIQGMVKTCKMKSTQYFDFVKNNIRGEEQEVLVETILQTASMLVSAYIPDEKFEEVSESVFDILYDMVCNDKRENLKQALANALLSYIKTDKHCDLALKWLEAGHFCNENGDKIESLALNANQKHTIVRIAHAKVHITSATKEKLLSDVIGDDKSDMSTNLKYACEALLPNKDTKDKVWKEIINHESGLSSEERSTKMGNFFNRSAAEIVKPYFDEYLKHVRVCAKIGDKLYVDSFINSACPSFGIETDFIDSLKKIASDFKKDVKHESYVRNIEKVAGSLEINKKIKDFASE
jgi:aminopeptidase N